MTSAAEFPTPVIIHAKLVSASFGYKYARVANLAGKPEIMRLMRKYHICHKPVIYLKEDILIKCRLFCCCFPGQRLPRIEYSLFCSSNPIGIPKFILRETPYCGRKV